MVRGEGFLNRVARTLNVFKGKFRCRSCVRGRPGPLSQPLTELRDPLFLFWPAILIVARLECQVAAARSVWPNSRQGNICSTLHGFAIVHEHLAGPQVGCNDQFPHS